MTRVNLVFDFGAVLFAWHPVALVAAAFPDQTAKQAATLADGLFGHPDWQGFDSGTVSMQEVVSRASVRLCLDPAALMALVQGIGDQLVPVDSTLDILTQWHQRRQSGEAVRLYYLSNMSPPYARTLESKYAFLKWFDGGIFSGDVHLIKPEPAIYQRLQDRYALDPSCTVFIDDVPANVQAAQALGWHGICFESAPQVRAELNHAFGS